MWTNNLSHGRVCIDLVHVTLYNYDIHGDHKSRVIQRQMKMQSKLHAMRNTLGAQLIIKVNSGMQTTFVTLSYKLRNIW